MSVLKFPGEDAITSVALVLAGSAVLVLQGKIGGVPPLVFLGVMLTTVGIYAGRDAWRALNRWLDDETS